MRDINRIVVHCSATPVGMDIGVAEITDWHKKRGFTTIGYHFVIRRDGTVETGRPVATPGAHALGANSDSIGICLVGGVDANDKMKADANFTLNQYGALVALLSNLCKDYGIDKKDIIGHRDVLGAAKACPCFDVQALLED
ncbi:lysozyme [bacterium]|nr:lysozyme [bacterium]